MSLSQKIVLYLLLLGICIGIGSYLAISYTILPAFKAFEVHESMEAIDRVESAIEAEARTLQTLVVEYANWEDTQLYVRGQKPNYIEYNMAVDYWRENGVDVMYILDIEGNVLFSLDTREGADGPPDIHELFMTPVTPSHPLLDHSGRTSRVTGVIRTADEPMIVSAAPIVGSLLNVERAGTFIMARRLGGALLENISLRASADTNIYSLTPSGAGGYSETDLRRLSAETGTAWTTNTDHDLIA
ncbi:MAG: CHASE4 domain-containing protein, partial [Woeseia sp.]